MGTREFPARRMPGGGVLGDPAAMTKHGVNVRM